MASNEKPTEVSAAARQEEFLSGRSNAERHREVHEDASHSTVALVATLEQYPETVEAISAEDRDGFARNAEIARSFVQSFGLVASEKLTPDLLDQAFQSWLEAADRQGYSNEAAIAVLGAAFGKYCSDTLSMNWIQVAEGSCVTFAVRASDCDVRAYPYDMIAKRLPNSEVGFFASVYLVLKNNVAMARLRSDA